ncbi:MAG TPA: YceI family protein [Elusimicrobiota bacterium]|jgi:polyisoprenoid-binding protein YceI|nr:YceI family protein [Elusimicrobiota bacterium]HMU96087.1 YceI family protein [Elusimicrobiota bacterium]HMX42252.1 YceI family protein [Elusimicrobiota bacterium]HMX94006.1 YceI family protein [Elusimicrobiota bacterium]HMZ27036.1 YceI family protein [Elusimicrobiota bacterium]
MFRKSLLFAVALATLGSLRAADTYTIDNAHSSVGFAVKHLMVTTTKGQFKDYTGTIQYDAKDISKSSVKVTIKTASINTDNNDRDNHLRSPDFFDATKNPDITFESTKIVKQGLGYEAAGKLTIKGVTKDVKIPFTINGPVKDPWGNTRIGVEGGLTINRQDFGVSWSKTLDNGNLVVANDVKIDLVIEGIQAKK